MKEAFLPGSALCDFKMASDGTVVVTCNGCAVFSFLPEARTDFLCMKCKLVTMLEEKITGLERQVKTLLRIREGEEFLVSKVQGTSVPQLQGRKEEEVGEALLFLITRDKRSGWLSNT